MILIDSYIKVLFAIYTIFAVSTLAVPTEPQTQYTAQEKAAIEKLRETIPDMIAEDDYFAKEHYLIRWLRARHMDVNAAARMIRETRQWRRDNNIDSIWNETTLKFSTPPYSYQGKDKDGRPVVFFSPTSIDLRKLVVSGQQGKALRTWNKMLEQGRHIIRNTTLRMNNGEELTEMVGVLDFNGFNLRQHMCIQCLGVYVDMMHDYESYFPGALKHFVIINVNRAAVPFVDFIRPFLSEATQKSLKVFSTHKPEWVKFLRSIIDENQLPFRFGGTNKNYL